ncbi:MAG: hypothetical protein HY243_13080 [Proteobacteria bacterium]|nr:hypothetical protein [Pseudomonadota bacterium]
MIACSRRRGGLPVWLVVQNLNSVEHGYNAKKKGEDHANGCYRGGLNLLYG